MVVPSFIERALAGEPIDIHGDGTQTRCFCHVSDIVRALRGLMDTPATSGEIFNVGSQQQDHDRRPRRTRPRAHGQRARSSATSRTTRSTATGIEDMLHREPSIEKINGRIGWQPEYDLDRIVGDVIAERRSLAAQAA